VRASQPARQAASQRVWIRISEAIILNTAILGVSLVKAGQSFNRITDSKVFQAYRALFVGVG
jgi:hypothetical protein